MTCTLRDGTTVSKATYTIEYLKLQDLYKSHHDAFLYLAKRCLYVQVEGQPPPVLKAWQILTEEGTLPKEIQQIVSNAIVDPHSLRLQDPRQPQHCVIL